MKSFCNKIMAFALIAVLMHQQAIHATTNANYAEMGTALATIPFDMVAQHHTVKGNKKAAALFHIASDILRLTNKGLFFHNNPNKSVLQFNRSNYVNGVIAGWDIIRLFKHISQLINSNTSEQDNSNTDNDDIASFLLTLEAENSDNTNDNAQAQEYSALAYQWKVVILPLAKGLSAFALAFAQDEWQEYFSGVHAQYVATATNLLSHLLEVYEELDQNSNYRKVLITAITLNVAWLATEINQYIVYENTLRAENERNAFLLRGDQWEFNNRIRQQQTNAIPLDQQADTNCLICSDSKDLSLLGCGHAYCIECLGYYVNTQITDQMNANIHCPDPDCPHNGGNIAHGEVRTILQANNTPENAFDRLLIRNVVGYKECPTVGCNHIYGNQNGRSARYTCPDCNQTYCAHCGIYHPFGISCAKAKIQNMDPETRNWFNLSENRTLCPRCLVQIERTSDCPNMNCGNCRAAFCLYCHQIGGRHRQNCNSRWFGSTPDGAILEQINRLRGELRWAGFNQQTQIQDQINRLQQRYDQEFGGSNA